MLLDVTRVKKFVNIMSVNSIMVHCNIIHLSYIQAPVVYNFFPNAAPGQKILEAPHNLIYLPVTVGVISTLSVWLTDQDGEHLDLRGEKVKGNGLYLAPHPRIFEGDRLFLKHGEDISDGAGLLMGKNSMFKNIPVLGWLL